MKKNYTSALAKSFETKWFANKTPDLFNLYNQVIEYLLSQYEGDNHRAIKGHGATPIYKFNKQVPNIESEISRISVKPKAQSVEIRFSPSIVNNIKLKKNLDSKNIKFKSRKNHVGEDIIGIEVNVYSTNDINLIEDLLTNYSVANFKSKPSYYYESSMQPPSICNVYQKRIIEGKEIIAAQSELQLSERFIKWIKKIGAYNINPEQHCNERDRIDVAFKLKKSNIISELKSLSSYDNSPKRAIRAAIGQLLDYQYFNKDEKNLNLWIVLDGDISKKEKDFITRINKNHNLSISIIYEKNIDNFIEFKN